MEVPRGVGIHVDQDPGHQGGDDLDGRAGLGRLGLDFIASSALERRVEARPSRVSASLPPDSWLMIKMTAKKRYSRTGTRRADSFNAWRRGTPRRSQWSNARNSLANGPLRFSAAMANELCAGTPERQIRAMESMASGKTPVQLAHVFAQGGLVQQDADEGGQQRRSAQNDQGGARGLEGHEGADDQRRHENGQHAHEQVPSPLKRLDIARDTPAGSAISI